MLLVAHLAYTKWCEKPTRWLKPRQRGTHLRVLGKSYPINTTWQGLYGFQNFCVLFLWAKVASALEGLTHSDLRAVLVYVVLIWTTYEYDFSIILVLVWFLKENSIGWFLVNLCSEWFSFKYLKANKSQNMAYTSLQLSNSIFWKHK